MTKIIILFILFFSLSIHSQEKVIEIVEAEAPKLDNSTIPFALLENVPIYKGCDKSLSNSELKKCISLAISNHVMENFKTKIIKKLSLPDGHVKIMTMFKIDTEGNIIDIKARSKYSTLEDEAIRVIKLIPKMEKPGFQRREPIVTVYRLPMTFNVKDQKILKDKTIIGYK